VSIEILDVIARVVGLFDGWAGQSATIR